MAGERMAPPEPTMTSDDTSYGLPAAAAAASVSVSGRAMASPTIVIEFTRSSATRRQIAVRVEVARRWEDHLATSEQRGQRAPLGGDMHERWRLQCDESDLGDALGELIGAGNGVFWRHWRAAANGGEEDILVTPDDAFRETRRATGVRDVDVVAGALTEGGSRWSGRRQRSLVGNRAWYRVRITAVLHDDEVSERGRHHDWPP